MGHLAGTGAVLRLLVRRDRVRLLVWVGAVVALVLVTAVSTEGIYPTQADLDLAAAAAQDNPVALAFNGPDQALDTLGGQVAFQVGAFGLTLVGLMSVLLLGRATRGEEESGRLELVRSMPVGRHAPLVAALLVVGAAQVLAATGSTLSLLSIGLDLHGSLVFGAGLLAVGVLFLALTAVTAQVAENPRVATGAAGGILGASYVLRGVGDMSGGALSWLSPVGWAQKARPFAGETWWPLALAAVVTVVLLGAALVLAERRDFGGGLVAPRPGPPRADPGLRGPAALALRLHRAAIAWWAGGTAILGFIYGSLTSSIEDFIGDNEAMAEMLASLEGVSLVDSYLATSLLITALLAAGPGLQIAGRMRAEEAELRAEPMLAAPMERRTWMGAHVAFALGGTALAMLAGGLALALGNAATGGGADRILELTVDALLYLPALFVVVGAAIVLFGLRPRWTAGGWFVLAACFVIAMFGPLLDLPQWAFDLSPVQHVPPAPASAIRALPLVMLGALGVALIGGGFAAFRRRDLATA
jgi:ABC-2 type transport system permease protein